MNFQKKGLCLFAIVVLGIHFVAFGVDYVKKQLPDTNKEIQKTEYQKTLELHGKIKGSVQGERITPDQVDALRKLGYKDDTIKGMGLAGKATVQKIIESAENKILEENQGHIKRLQDAGFSQKEAEAIVLKKPEAMGILVEQAIDAKKIPQPNIWSKIKESFSGVINKLKPIAAKKIDSLSVQSDVPEKFDREALAQKKDLSEKGVEAITKVKMADANIEFEKDQKNPGGVLRELAIKIAALNTVSKASAVIREREKQVKTDLEKLEFKDLSKEDQRKLREANSLILETDPKKLKNDKKAAQSAYVKQLKIMQNMIKRSNQIAEQAKLKKEIDEAKKLMLDI